MTPHQQSSTPFPTRRSSDLQVRLDAKVSLRSTQSNPETGHHFVENQDSPVLVAHLPQGFQETRYRGDTVHIAGYRLDDDCRDRKSTRLNSSHVASSYAVFCL